MTYSHGAAPSRRPSPATYPHYTTPMRHIHSAQPPRQDRTIEGVPSPSRPESEVTLVRLGQVVLEDGKKDQDEPSPRSSKTYSELEAASKNDSSKLRRDSGASYLQPIDEYNAEIDIAPVDQPPEIQALQDREPFAILARHLSGVSTGTVGDREPAPQAFDPPPDGGTTAWLVVMGAWFVLFVQFGISKCDYIYLFPQNCILTFSNQSLHSASSKNITPPISWHTYRSSKSHGVDPYPPFACSSSACSAADTLILMVLGCSSSVERQQESLPSSV